MEMGLNSSLSSPCINEKKHNNKKEIANDSVLQLLKNEEQKKGNGPPDKRIDKGNYKMSLSDVYTSPNRINEIKLLRKTRK